MMLRDATFLKTSLSVSIKQVLHFPHVSQWHPYSWTPAENLPKVEGIEASNEVD